ncbi:UNVERIFIED_CONTAM: Leucine-rich repeat extensin-like protein 2 [Sesamum radiatum]|uniref:Leucine-rich repeat extensin-like protein 2 n=1 Tax=Sesamum radiatum TaxID=300843 RepID=A0AAW2R3E6_SESRA
MPPPSRGAVPPSLFLTVLVLGIFASQIPNVVAGEGDIDLDDINRVANSLSFENPNLRQAYIALQAWKKAIFSDPFNFTANWTGSDVVLSLPSLKFLDLRFNEFEGGVPSQVFDKDLDALFLNDNRFQFGIPENLGNSPVSVLVLANNNLGGCIPGSIGKMGKTLNELILMNDNLTGCLPPQIGMLKELTVFDVSFNNLQGPLPSEVSRMRSLEQLDVAHNRLTGEVPAAVCQLPRLQNFTYSYNYFTGEAPECSRFGGGAVSDGRENCIPNKSNQRSAKECSSDAAKPFDCSKSQCGGGGSVAPVPSRRRPVAPNPPSPKPARGPRPFIRPSPPPPPTSKSSPSSRSHPPPPPPPTKSFQTAATYSRSLSRNSPSATSTTVSRACDTTTTAA